MLALDFWENGHPNTKDRQSPHKTDRPELRGASHSHSAFHFIGAT
jgi:hypothetical protein